MTKKQVTTEQLATMVKRGFDEVTGRLGDVTDKMAKKTDTDRQFREVTDRLDRIEKLTIADHKRRIERLEADVRYLKDVFAIK